MESGVTVGLHRLWGTIRPSLVYQSLQGAVSSYCSVSPLALLTEENCREVRSGIKIEMDPPLSTLRCIPVVYYRISMFDQCCRFTFIFFSCVLSSSSE